jgi:hypothetical protein
MLEKLLAEIGSNGTLQPATLAARLNVSVGLVNMMLEDLERRGLLAQIDTNAGESCGGCSLSGDCSVTCAKGRLWVLKQGSFR